MSYFRKKIERRTFSQDRYYILIKRQKAGVATLSELTELDEIVNRVPDIREQVLRENFEEFAEMPGDSTGDQPPADNPVTMPVRPNLWSRFRSFLKQSFTVNADAASHKISTVY
jgi:hypothetical protein